MLPYEEKQNVLPTCLPRETEFVQQPPTFFVLLIYETKEFLCMLVQ